MRFEYMGPTTVEEAISLLQEYDGRAKVIAGGTDLLVQIRDGKIAPEFVIDIGGIGGLDTVKYEDGKGLTIGALSRISSLEKSPVLQQRLPILSHAASQLGSIAIRNMGTVGGNLCNAAPSAETAPALIALSGNARIVGPKGERRVPLEDFFTGPGATVLEPGELMIEIEVPEPPPNTKGVYLKHGMRGTIDLAVVGVAVVASFDAEGETCSDIRIVLGAVAPTPIRARSAEEILRGKKPDEALINQCARAAVSDSQCISDVRASAEYRREMVEVFTRRALKDVMAGK